MTTSRRDLLKTGVFLGAALPLRAGAAPAGPVRFPAGFHWGAATAAYQIEGAAGEDGRGPSIWDSFARTPGKVLNGDTGDVACDSYHRWREDIALLRELGLKSYRFSIAWPRVQPTGSGPANRRGLDHYARFVDALLAAGIRPMPTLYHWDLPQPLEDAGGWPARDTAGRFADYAGIVGRALSDRIGTWTVFNEPKTFVQVGYWEGIHAPGRRDPAAAMRASHTVNLAYAEAWRVLKSIRSDARVGNALDMAPMYPATASAADAAAARRWDVLLNHWYLVPALTGRYPEGALPIERVQALVGFRPGDDRRLKAGYDFVGLNFYSPWRVAAAQPEERTFGLALKADWATAPAGRAQGRMAIGWDIYPPALRDILNQLNRMAGGVPIEITENGAAFNMGPDAAGRIDDAPRTAYLRAHLAEIAAAIGDGVPVRGYHAWSLLDNFEWALGYSQRFGICHVDFTDPDRRRRIKDSGRWYARVAAANALV